ncbi:PHGDH [Cordylochernes scorpioides]|uniref:PHGDH n=1 Tax=Cordylochernes scorpioides TaxID=51811 RepID=A0ABY6K4Z3_9ARAC|nr:PHGDH [Cordylochernes scorpioides]
MSFSIKKVLITESVDPQCAEILSKNGIEVTTKVGLSKDDLLKEIKDYDGLVVRSATKVTAEVIEAASSLKVVGRAGTGVDNVDCVAASHRGVLVIKSLLLPLLESVAHYGDLWCRHIPQGDASMKAGRWDRKLYMGSEVHGKTLAIVGLGRIGREVANTMQAAGMVTIGYDPLVPAEESIKFGVKSYPLEEIWPLADYITVHVPLIKQTKGLIDSRVLGICKKGVKIVNCARGGIVDEEALLAALESGQCGGAGLDVYCQEPPQNTALVQHPRVVATPHLGASTVEAQSRVALEIAEQFVDLTHGRNVPGVVSCLSVLIHM